MVDDVRHTVGDAARFVSEFDIARAGCGAQPPRDTPEERRLLKLLADTDPSTADETETVFDFIAEIRNSNVETVSTDAARRVASA